MGLGFLEMILLSVVSTIVTMTIVYYLIRFAVRDGMVDAQRRIETERVRAQLGVGPERGVNSRQ